MTDNNNHDNQEDPKTTTSASDANEPLASDVVGQKLQSAEEVYVYKIPPLKSAAAGHRADDWNLANPLKNCSLLVEQHGDILILLFQFRQIPDDAQSLTVFAKAKIDLSNNNSSNNKKLSMEYFVESVVDSSRYFVVRILDEASGREARIGFGFRDREEATDFRESLNYYQKSLRRQEEAAQAAQKLLDAASSSSSDDNAVAAKLSLGAGEKLHISLGPNSKSKKKSTIVTTPDRIPKKLSGSTGKPVLLKKPPPAGNVAPLSPAPHQKTATTPASPALQKDVSISFGDIDINAVVSGQEDSSTAALGDLSLADDGLDTQVDDNDIDDDDFGDFEQAS